MRDSDRFTRITYFYRRPSPGFFSIERIFDLVQDGLSSQFQYRRVICPFVSQGILRRTLNALSNIRLQGDINHVTGDTHYLANVLSGRRTILTIHDFIMMRRLRGLARWTYFIFWLWWPVRRVAAVTVVSKAVADELSVYMPDIVAKITVVPNPLSPEFVYVPKVFNERAPRVLFVGTSENKNLDRAANALKGIFCTLVVVGPLTEIQVKMLNKLDLSWENYCDLNRQHLLGQYVDADLLLFPTLYEGFGLPIIEAQAVGRPVITSDIPPLTEVAGAAALFIDPNSVKSIRSGVLRLTEDKEYRRELIEQGLLNVKRFSVTDIIKQYERLYDRVIAQAGHDNFV